MTKQFRFLFFSLFFITCQCLTAQENEPCTAICLSALGSVSNTTPDADGFSPNVNFPCGGGTSEDNSTWYAFTPLTDTFSVSLTVGSCTNGSSVQVTFFEGDDCNSLSSAGCLNCVITGTISLATIPGKQYWIQVDGCAEAVCAYTLSYDPTKLSLNIPAPIIIGDLVVDNIGEHTYQGTFDANSKYGVGFEWTITPNATIKNKNDSEGTITYKFSNLGKYTICAKPYPLNGKCVGKPTLTKCLDIEVRKTATFIKGEVFEDKNKDRQRQANELGLINRIVEINGNQYAKTNADGYFRGLPPAQHSLTTKAKNIYETACPPVSVDLKDSAVADIPLIITKCPLLNVDISTGILRRCQNNYYYVNYCNIGSDTAKNAYITVALDPYMSYVSSSIPLTKQVDNLLTFNVGNVKMNECKNFNIATFLSCDAMMNATHCVTAHIYPDSICLTPPNDYSGAKVAVKARCDDKNVKFIIINTGKNAMSSAKSYQILENEEIYQSGTFNLIGEDSVIITVPKNGSTYRIEAEQENNYPFFKSRPSAWIEACGTNAQGGTSLNMINKYPKDDDDPFTAIYCRQNVGSYDPNEKITFPTGIKSANYIAQNTSLEYELHFQNEGKDTAFLVVLRDTLSKWLDVNTLQVGASSHPYRWDIDGNGVLSFTFEKIHLTTKKSDEEKSKGHVKFRIDQKTDVPLKTIIKNRVGIYFDINPVVMTNEVFHTIGKDFMNAVSVKNMNTEQVNLKVYPNPFENNITFELAQSDNLDVIELSLFSVDGKLVEQVRFQSSTLQVSRNNLPKGLYFYTLKIGNKGSLHGKIIAE
jgi:Secretion system C-terminal sorting domain